MLKKENKWGVGFKWWVIRVEWCCLCILSCFQFLYNSKKCQSIECKLGKTGIVQFTQCSGLPCIEQPELWGGWSSPCPQSSQLSVWLQLRCCRPLHLTVGFSRFPPETPSPLWSHRLCSRFSPRRQQVHPWCRPAGSEPWSSDLGPPLGAAWCFPPAGAAGQCCEVAREGDIREMDVRLQVFLETGRWNGSDVQFYTKKLLDWWSDKLRQLKTSLWSLRYFLYVLWTRRLTDELIKWSTD